MDQNKEKSVPKSDPSRALWYAIKVKDYTLAQQLLSSGASYDRCFEIQPGQFISTISLLVKNIAQARISKTHKSTDYKIPDGILDQILALCSDAQLRCHCSLKFEHRCPIYFAIKGLGITKDQDLMLEKNQLVLKLVNNGATFKNINLQKKKIFPEIDLEGVFQYLMEKTKHQGNFYRHPSNQSQNQSYQVTFGQRI